MSNIKLAIFDLDGTLIDSVKVHSEAWSDSCKSFGYNIPESYFYNLTGMTSKSVGEKLVKDFRMSENIIDLIPVPIGQHTIGNGVKTRNMVLVDKHRPIVLTDARKVVVISTNHHRIEQQKHKNGDNSKPTLFTTNSKNGKNLFHFFRKYLTNKKFIGTQTANIGSGAQFFETPSAKNRLRNNVCNRKLMQ